ncbi:TonB-dependent receptor [Hoeflea olei]|nr:TonB-dependent receptor [Hoeflea olei]
MRATLLASAVYTSSITVNPAQAQETTELPAISVRIADFLASLFGDKTTIDGQRNLGTEEIGTRSGGSGDPNDALRNLPNVQYQDDTDNDAGINDQDLLDTRPRLLSISGGKTYENNFVLDGISNNNLTGTVERSATELSDDGFPNADKLYGLHPEANYVPASFLSSVEVHDSNVSARYGNFLGGVVVQKLQKADEQDFAVKFDVRHHADWMVNYHLGTDDGTNPLDRAKPSFSRTDTAVSVGGRVNDVLSVMGRFSRKQAETTIQKSYEMGSTFADEDSTNDFYNLDAVLDTDIGRFSSSLKATRSSRLWVSSEYQDMHIDVENEATTLKFDWDRQFDGVVVDAIGLADLHVNTAAYSDMSKTGNYSNADTSYAWVGMRRKKVGGVWETTFDATTTDSYCRAQPVEALSDLAISSNTICYTGGWGSFEQSQTTNGMRADVDGKIFMGTFTAGAQFESVKGRRHRLKDLTYYTSFRTATGETASPAGGAFTCPDGDETCTSEQYARIKSVWETFDVERTVNQANAYLELDQDVTDWLNVRAGLRADYEDYFDNLNLSPRLTATVKPFDWLSVNAGFNRYYSASTLAYALRDAQPRGQTYTRGHDAAGNVEAEWTERADTGVYSYEASGLNTPYKDETVLGIAVQEPLMGGLVRLRLLDRQGHDEFARAGCEATTSSTCYRLTNDGASTYRSATLDYVNNLDVGHIPRLDRLTFIGSATWSEQSRSTDSYFDTDGELEYILYKGESYTQESFTAVTGNLDIPVRMNALLTADWFDGRFTTAAEAALNLGYYGVYDTGVNEMFNGYRHDVYDDKKFGAVLTFNVSASYQMTDNFGFSLMVNNLFDETGNAVAGNSKPWVEGRSFRISANGRF